jgi:hypothetical protein
MRTHKDADADPDSQVTSLVYKIIILFTPSNPE